MSKSPSGVIFGIRSWQVNNADNKLLQYNFTNNQLLQTGFNIIVNINTQLIFYQKLIVDYLVAFNVDKLVIYSKYPVKTSTPAYQETIGGQVYLFWESRRMYRQPKKSSFVYK